MAPDKRTIDKPGGPGKETGAGEPGAKDAGELCRCKQTAIMKPRQLLRLMIDDLSFWKKAKKGKPGA